MNNVWETKALVKMPKKDEAKKLLDRLASICAPVMGRRQWRVKCLKEFYPTNAGLLGMNVNRGASILIRLRPGHDKDSFLPWHDVLGTMVHELTHMSVGSHSAEFYKLMDQIHDEVDKDGGIMGTEKMSMVGATWMTESHRLGGSKTATEGNHSKAATAAAEKRIKLSAMTSSSGQRLGGSAPKPLSASDRRNLSANAAEKRIRDDICCDNTLNYDEYDNDELYESVTVISKSSVGNKKQWSCRICSTLNGLIKERCSNCATFNKVDSDSLAEQSDRRGVEAASSARILSKTTEVTKEQQLLCAPCSDQSIAAINKKRSITIDLDYTQSDIKASSVSSAKSNQQYSTSSSSRKPSCVFINLADSDDENQPVRFSNALK